MIYIVIGIAVLAGLLWLASVIASTDTRVLAQGLRYAAGYGALGLGGLLLLLGRFSVGPLLIGLGLFVLARARAHAPVAGGGRVSRVRSAFLDMELDHDTGALTGTVLAGPHEGRRLDDLPVTVLVKALPTIDRESAALLEAYLDRRTPGWRDDLDADGDTRGSGGPPPQAGRMTPEEAYQILGLMPGADLDAIRHAHRTLMKKLHPDQGGSTYLAARVNEAKDVLVEGLTRRHE